MSPPNRNGVGDFVGIGVGDVVGTGVGPAVGAAVAGVGAKVFLMPLMPRARQSPQPLHAGVGATVGAGVGAVVLGVGCGVGTSVGAAVPNCFCLTIFAKRSAQFLPLTALTLNGVGEGVVNAVGSGVGAGELVGAIVIKCCASTY